MRVLFRWKPFDPWENGLLFEITLYRRICFLIKVCAEVWAGFLRLPKGLEKFSSKVSKKISINFGCAFNSSTP